MYNVTIMEYLISLADGISISLWLPILLCILIFLFVGSHRGKVPFSCNSPPGPKGVPIFGLIPSFINRQPHVVFQKWTEKYGNVCHFTLGNIPTVTLGDADTVREAIVTKAPAMDSRSQLRYFFVKTFGMSQLQPAGGAHRIITKQNREGVVGVGIGRHTWASFKLGEDERRQAVLSPMKGYGLSGMPFSSKWRNTRKRTMQILRNLGMGKACMEKYIHEEASCLVNNMLEAGNDGSVSFNPSTMLRQFPMNILLFLLFGERYEYNNSNLVHALEMVERVLNILNATSFYDILPKFLQRVLQFNVKYFHQQLSNLQNFLDKRVKEQKENYNVNESNNFTAAWMKTSNENLSTKENSNRFHSNHEHCQNSSERIEEEYSSLPDILQDMIMAGANSVGSALNWAVLFMVIEKKAQDKAYKQIIDVVGSERAPRMTDRTKLAYIDAWMYETIRVSSVITLVGRYTAQDTVINGYDVPKNTEVIYNNWLLNHDEKHFPDSYSFKPERWLDEKGELRKDHFQYFFPFGLGKRSCVGQILAKMEIFVSIATLLQKLEFLPPASHESVPESMLPAIEHQFGLVTDCKPFVMRARRRPTFVSAE